MELSDVFIFSDYFDKELVIRFREIFLKDFTSMDDYFEYPKYSQETFFETDSLDEMFEFILEEEGRPFAFYFEKDSLDEIKMGIIQINNDASICLSLSVELKDEAYFSQLLKSNFPKFSIYISNNLPLPMSSEFLRNNS